MIGGLSKIVNICKTTFLRAYQNNNISVVLIRNYSCKMTNSAIVLLAPGAEELEFTSAVDILRRGGVKVTVAGVCGPDAVKCRSETVISPDMSLTDAMCMSPFDAVVIPGGLVGAQLCCESADVGSLLKTHQSSDKIIAAICAGPTALKAHCIGTGKRVTSYPGNTAEEMKKGDMYKYEPDCPVVVDGKLITSRGPATASLFALTILENIAGIAKAQEIAKQMLYEYK